MCELIAEQWFSYEDDNGRSICQTDYYLLCDGFILLLECKLTQTDSAIAQMAKLYKPILEHIYEVPVICVQVCKNLRYRPPNAIRDIKQLIDDPRYGIHTWHFTI